tara:strand:- start:47 stop:220 length:174 start_codon:yes stop_codon:yes gene_type:complete
MSAKYLKVKIDGKWNFVAIPNAYVEYQTKLKCECDKCAKIIHPMFRMVASDVYMEEE